MNGTPDTIESRDEVNGREDRRGRDPDALRSSRRPGQSATGRRSAPLGACDRAWSWPSCPSCSTPATASAPTSGPTARRRTAPRSRTSASAAGSGAWRSPRGSSSATAGISTIRSPSATPDGDVHVYRKRNLVFWERFRFHPGRSPLVVSTPWGRVGFAICADMIYRKVWNDYRDRIDLAVVSAAWPDFADRDSGRRHWLLGPRRPALGGDPGEGRHRTWASRSSSPTSAARPARRSPSWAPGSATGSPARAASATAGTARRCVPAEEPSLLIAPITLHQQRG